MLGSQIQFAHAGITAEGDNSVLMQKVAKELLSAVQKGEVVLPQIDTKNIESWDLLCQNDHLKLFQIRESTLIQELGNQLQEEMTKGKSLFDVWMKEESDRIQHTARAYGERVVLEQFISTISGVQPTAKPILTKLCQLYSLWTIEQDLSFYLVHGLIPVSVAIKISGLVKQLVKELGPHSVALVNAFGAGFASTIPISSDWVKYNERDNQGELLPLSKL